MFATDRFSRRVDMFAVTTVAFITEDKANILEINIFPSGDAYALSSRTAASSSAPSLHKLFIIFLASINLPQAPKIQTTTEALNG